MKRQRLIRFLVFYSRPLTLVTVFLIVSGNNINAQTPTLQDVTTPPGNVTTNDVYLNRILGVEANRSSIMIGTGNSYNSGGLNGQSYLIGYHNSSNSHSSAILGSFNSVSGPYNYSGNTLIGKYNTSSMGQATLVGHGNSASLGQNGNAIGNRNSVSGIRSSAIGTKNTVSNWEGSSIGCKNVSSGFRSSTFGYDNHVSGEYAASIGTQNYVSNKRAAAVGIQNHATGEKSIAFGYQSVSAGMYSVSFGKENYVTGTRGVAIGCNNSVTAPYAHAFGRDLSNSVDHSVKLGVSNTAYLMVLANGNVGIGTEHPNAKLSVDGTVFAKKVRVTITPLDWADFVFDSTYKLRSLKEVEEYIIANKHLPEVPSSKQLVKDGVDLVQTQSLLLQKVEELTLYTIALQKQIESQDKEIQKLKVHDSINK